MEVLIVLSWGIGWVLFLWQTLRLKKLEREFDGVLDLIEKMDKPKGREKAISWL